MRSTPGVQATSRCVAPCLVMRHRSDTPEKTVRSTHNRTSGNGCISHFPNLLRLNRRSRFAKRQAETPTQNTGPPHFTAIGPCIACIFGVGQNLWSRQEKSPNGYTVGASWNKCPAVSYFHMGKPHTIIGAKRFHFRVRDGVGWFPLAMAARQTVWTRILHRLLHQYPSDHVPI